MSDYKTYKDAGVDIEAGDFLVSKIKEKVLSTYGKNVKSGVGGFASLYEFSDHYLASGTDGVGTKLKLAFDLDKHHTIGQDLVAMSVNDILCTGAKPLFFLDYIGTGKLIPNTLEKVVEGIVQGCLKSECALIGGETAEMPGMYSEGEYDLAGFAVGSVKKEDILDGSQIADGQSIIGLASSGFHSNGYSLIRSLLNEKDGELKRELLTPTRIYWKSIKELLERNLITGLAHITGGGLQNISRLSKKFDYYLNYSEVEKNLSGAFKEIIQRSHLPDEELYKTFNMGIGMVIITSEKEKVLTFLAEKLDYPFYELGEVRKGRGVVLLENKKIEFDSTL